MGWLQRTVRSLARRAAKYAGVPLRDPALVAMLGNSPTSSGVDVDEHVALNYSAVWAANQVISTNVAALPPIPYEVRDGGHFEARDHIAWKLLTVAPNPEMSPYTFFETLQHHATTWGNGYARLDRASPEDTPSAMWPMMPNQVEPDRDEKTGEITYRFSALYPGEKDEEVPWWKVLHVPGLGFDGLKGYGVIEMARESMGLGIAAEKFGAAFFGRGCTLGGILQMPPEFELTEKSKKNLRESFELIHRGPDNAHRIALLEDGMEYKDIGVPPEDAQFLQTRQFQIVEVARWFNIPPHLLRDLTHATFSNIEQQGIEFFTITLRPWLLRWAQELRRKMFGLPDQTRYFVAHDPHNLQMMETSARYTAYSTGRNGGWLTLNDILKREGKNPLPPEIGDTRLAPSTMRVLGKEEPIDPNNVRAVMDLLAAMQPIHPEGAKALILAMIPGIAADAMEALIRRLPDYKPTVKDATAGNSGKTVPVAGSASQ